MDQIQSKPSRVEANHFTQDQYNHIVQMLAQHSPQVNQNSMSNTAANTAGMTSLMAMNVSHKPNWIVDTGATNHMASSLELLNKLSVNKLGYNRTVELPNGDETRVTHTGLSSISDGSTISNVLYVPEFKFNLLSVSKLTKELQCSASFFPDFFVL